MANSLLIHARIATMRGGRYSFLEDGAIACANGLVAWIGPTELLDRNAATTGDCDVVDAGGALVTPGLIDAHTHLVYAGNRAHEFELRLQGASYEEVARAGGGIVSTVRATREASPESLREQSRARLRQLLAEGVTTVEIKSGYGLDLENELKCLRVARSLGDDEVRITTTFLGAHAVPPEYAGRTDAYVDAVCRAMIPAVAKSGFADAVDAFCDGIGFTREQTRRVFAAANAAGLPVKLHADQLSNLGGAALAAEFGALSADHLEHTDEAGVAALAKAGTVAMLLPGAFHYLRETKLPLIDSLRRHGVPMAVATDSNPGTSPTTSLLAMLNFACVLFCLTPEEALAGVTSNAARALGLRGEIGTLEAGKAADFVVWDAEDPAELSYSMGAARPNRVCFAGNLRSAVPA